jgi:anti-anti-sigma regulatory factor
MPIPTIPKFPLDDTNNHEIICTVDNDNNVKRIVCNIADAKAEYIIDLKNVDAFSSMFIDALAWKLASMIAVSLSKDIKTAQYAGQMASYTLANAKHKEALQLNKPISQGNRYMAARR